MKPALDNAQSSRSILETVAVYGLFHGTVCELAALETRPSEGAVPGVVGRDTCSTAQQGMGMTWGSMKKRCCTGGQAFV